MAEFLQRLPLPRLVHFLDMILPQMVPVQSPHHLIVSLSALEWDVEYTLNATKFYWSRSDIMHVAIAWNHEPLLLLATVLLSNRTTASFESKTGPPYDKQRFQMGLRSGNIVLICFRSGFGHFQSVLIALAADLHTNKPSRGYLNGWCVPTTVLLWTSTLKSPMERCTTCREVMKMKSTSGYSRTYTILEIPKVPRS